VPGTDANQFVALDYGDPAAEAFFDATQEVLGTLGRLDLTLASATTIRALAGAGPDESGMGIGGALRWMDANVDRVMPAAAAGRFDIYVTTGPTLIAPGAPPVDTTDYSWDLAIVAAGAPAPATAYAKRVGYLDWDGAAITRLVQTFMRRDDAAHAAVAPTGGISALEALSPAGATAPPIRAQVGAVEVFRVNPDGSVPLVGTLSAPNAVISGAGKLALAMTAADAGITFGGDTNIYRGGADVLRSDDNIWAAFNISAQVGGAGQSTIGAVGPGGAAGVLLNDATLYRGAAATLQTDGAFTVGGAATLAGGVAGTLRHTGALLGFYGAVAVARPAARAQNNWTLAANALRAIDRNTYTPDNLFDYVATVVSDLQTVGLLA
jgi:hypothetical protein